MELFLSTMSHIFLLLGHMQIFFLIMSRFWISVGGFLAFFCICPAFGFLWEVSLPFLAYVPPFNTATKSLSVATMTTVSMEPALTDWTVTSIISATPELRLKV